MNFAAANEMTAKWEAQKAARTFAAQALIQTHPHLVPAGDSLTTAAKNIRIELKRAFPAVKFSVKTERYSGGDSIRVRWVDGPTSDQVERIINRYEGGSFDGMTDSYNHRNDHAWTDAFGEAKYIFADREHSEKAVLSAARRVKNKLGGIEESIEEIAALWNKGDCYRIKQSGGCDVARAMTQAISKHTYCVEIA